MSGIQCEPDITHLRFPPPLPGVHLMVDVSSLRSISVVSFRCEDKVLGEGWVTK